MTRQKPKILVVDDEADAVELIAFNLNQAGFEVIEAADGNEAIQKARSQLPDLILLDLMLPEIDGLSACKLLRADVNTAHIPIIMVTAKAAEVDRILGLEFGADDYVTKPFSPRELILRVKNLLKRYQAPEETGDLFEIGPIRVDVQRHAVLVEGKPVELTATEFKLLTILAQRRGRVQSRDQLLRDVWDYHSGIDTRTVDTHVRRLREKLGPASDMITTVRNVGYRITDS